MDEGRIAELLQAATQAIEAGDSATARRLLSKVIKDQPNNEMAWLWLAVAVESLDQRKDCLERVLAINPNNRAALETLAEINRINLPPQETAFQRSELAPDEDAISPVRPADAQAIDASKSTNQATGGLRNRLLHMPTGWSSQPSSPLQSSLSPILEPPSQPVPADPEVPRSESTIPGLAIDREEAAEIKPARVSLHLDLESAHDSLREIVSRASADRSGQLPILLGGIVALLAVVVLLFSVRGFLGSLEPYQNLMNYGVVATAQVVNISNTLNGNGSDYLIEYTYAVRLADKSQQAYTRSEVVSSQTGSGLQPGGSVQIRYLPSNPQQASLESQLAPPVHYPSMWVAGLSLVALLVASGILFYGLGIWIQTVRLDRRGLVAHGLIIDRWTEPQKDGQPLNLLAFRYETAARGKHTLRSYTRGQPVSKETYQQARLGGKVLVRYLPEAPGEGRLIE